MKIILDPYGTDTITVHAVGIHINTITANVVFSHAEFDAVLKYDKARQYDNQKIIIDLEDTALAVKCRIFPIRLNNAVESGDVEITELEIISDNPVLGLYHHQILLESINFRPKHLYIRALNYSFNDVCDQMKYMHEHCFITSFIKKYEGTIDKLTLYFEKIDMDFFLEIYEELERLAINTPINISLTAVKDKHNISCESIEEYNDMQEILNFINNCRHYSKEYGESLNAINDNTRIYEKIQNDNPGFIENFSQFIPSIAKQIMGNYMYNAFLRCYINDSTIVKALSECCYNYTQQRMHLPDDVKECIVKHIGGITELDEIDKALKHDNITTDQQD